MLIKENYSLKDHNTFGLDVKAKWFAEYESIEQLKEILSSEIAQNNKILSIGMGSNLLFTGDFDGLILHSAIKFIEKVAEDEVYVKYRVGAGVPWDYFCNYMAKLDCYGTENLSLIPGDVGAAAVQNIGAYGVEVCDIIDSVETIEIKTGKEKIFKQDTSSRADEGSPCLSELTLSISSNINTGFEEPTLIKLLTILPGIAPI